MKPHSAHSVNLGLATFHHQLFSPYPLPEKGRRAEGQGQARGGRLDHLRRGRGRVQVLPARRLRARRGRKQEAPVLQRGKVMNYIVMEHFNSF